MSDGGRRLRHPILLTQIVDLKPERAGRDDADDDEQTNPTLPSAIEKFSGGGLFQLFNAVTGEVRSSAGAKCPSKMLS